MIYSDNELRGWWAGLTLLEKEELFEEVNTATEGSSFAASMESQFRTGRQFSCKQLASLRKFWDNRR